MKKKNRKNKSVLLRVLILGVCIYMIATLSGLWSTLNQSRKELETLKAEYAEEQNDIEELRAMLEDGSQSQIIEKAARERLGYIYPDEQVFIDISGN
ncbi:MAG: septum formation initiator family protein [Acutalibacteraceae bacterium]|nr:septum formation initiator family protein [Acutalibacteraceae bacterium]